MTLDAKGRKKDNLDTWFVDEVLPYQTELARYMARISRKDMSDVMDMVQEALVRVYAVAKEKRPENGKKFLYKTAKNLFLDEVRRSKVVTIETVGEYDLANTEIEQSNPDVQALVGQEWCLLNEALNNLPEKSKKVVIMRRVYGFSQRETAQKLNLSESSVESHIKRGVLKLAETLRYVSSTAEKHMLNRESKRKKTIPLEPTP